MTDVILDRICKQLGITDLPEKLGSLSQSDLNSLLLTVYKSRLSNLAPRDLLIQSPVSDPCNLSATEIRTIEDVAFKAASAFENIELSPLVPIGTVGTLAGLDQGNVLSTVRAFEVCSDPTSAMAIECAKRRKELATRAESIRLCCSHRVVRFPLPKTKGFTSHFKLFAMVSAGRNVGAESFELAELCQHLDTYLRFLLDCARSGLLKISAIQVKICDPSVMKELIKTAQISDEEVRKNVRAGDSESSERLLSQHNADWPRLLDLDEDEQLRSLPISDHGKSRLNELRKSILEKLKPNHPEVEFKIDLQRLTGIQYYGGPCFHIRIKADSDSNWQMISDGGACAWTQMLLTDRKERLITSAIGIELLLRLFKGKNEKAQEAN